MNRILRNVLAVLAALLAGGLIIMLFEGIATMQYPIPDDVNRHNVQQMSAWIATLPAIAFIWVFLGHIVAAYAAGLVAWLIARSTYVPSMVAAALLMMGGLINLVVIPHPWWMWTELLFYLPAAFLGARLLRK